MLRNLSGIYLRRSSRALFVFLNLTVFFFAFNFSSPAQSLNFRNYSVEDGLPFVQVYTIFQDTKGYLWSGGYGGLSRFDGRDFDNFSPRNGLPNFWVTSITQDSRDDLWIGTIQGASRFSNGKFENFDTTNGLPDNYVNCILHDERNLLWFGTAKGLCTYNGETFSQFGKDAPQKTSILCFYQEINSSRIWMGTSDGIYVFENNAFTHYQLSPFLDRKVNAIAQDKDGHILAGTSDGLFRLDNGHFNLLLTPQGFEMPSVSSLMTDREGITWIGANNGLFSYDGTTFKSYRVSSEVSGNNIVCLYEDYEGSLWLGTTSGLYRFRGEGFTSYREEDGLANNFIFGVRRDVAGNLWVCSQTEGVFKYDGKTFIHFGKKEGLASDNTFSVQEMQNGDVYIGTDHGLSKISKGKIKNYSRADGLFSDSVTCMLVDHRGRLWLTGGKGLTLFENEKGKSFEIPSPPETVYDIWSIYEDRTGRIWLGTYTQGLFSFNPEENKFRNERTRLHLSAHDYFSINEDNDGRLYFGTLGGVFIVDNNKVDSLTEADGLSSELIYCATMDPAKRNLWIGTNQGISKFDISAYARDKKKAITTFGKEEGFMGVECNSNGAFADADGIIWFGTVNGLIRYSPKDFRNNSAYAKTSITGIKLFYYDTTLVDGVELPYYDNNISFEYVGICLTNPSKVQYKYMLAGFDAAFSPPTYDRVARYSNLPPGNYIFKVLSCNNEGLWNTEAQTFSFSIATPIWKRSWFWLLLSLISVGLLGLTIYYRIRQIKKVERIETEAQVAMSRNELKALRAQMNPHFVFNSLNSIQHFILTNKTADAGKYLNKFARLMRVILNNSEKSLITIAEELEYLQLYLELEEMRFEGKFKWTVDISKEIDTDYFEIPAMLLQPYVENAILHGLMPKNGGGHLQIIMRLKENKLVCSVVDDGIGREKAREMRQLSNRKDHQSLGMKITHDRLELINRLHGSQLSLTITDLYNEDGTPSGTRVDIFIPVS
jgi:ligand-binding sensor domain-containing protein